MKIYKNPAILIGHTDGKGKTRDKGAYSSILGVSEWELFHNSIGLLRYSGTVYLHNSNLAVYGSRQRFAANLTKNHDLVIELHFNASSDNDGDGFGDGFGCEFIYNEANENAYDVGVRGCQEMKNQYDMFIRRGDGAIPLAKNERNSRGKLPNGHGFIFEHDPDAVLFEFLFGDNDEDCEKILKDASKMFTHVLPAMVGKCPMNKIQKWSYALKG